jgi:hypothetical protein
MDLLSRYSGLVLGLADKTLGVLSSDILSTPRKTASANSCENLSTIQRSDQELWTSRPDTLVLSVVWPDKTLSTLSSDILLTQRKIASANS